MSNTDAIKVEIKKVNNDIRESRAQLEIAKENLRTVDARRKRFEVENQELERTNNRLKDINKRAATDRNKLFKEMDGIKDKLKQEEIKTENIINERLNELEKLMAEYATSIKNVANERDELSAETNKYIEQKRLLEKEQDKVLTFQASLNILIDDTKKEREEMIRKQGAFDKNILELKNEETRIDIMRLRVLKTINDNKNITALEGLRKELE